jgi:hypothetical protein
VIDEQKAAGWWTCEDTNGDGAACVQLSFELALAEGVLLPLGLIWTFVVPNGD